MKRSLFFFFILFFSLSTFAQSLEEKDNLIKGNLNYESKRFNEAESFYQNTLKGNKKSIIANYNHGNALFKQDKIDEAILAYKKSSKLTQNNQQQSSIYHNLGNTYMKKQEYNKAVQAYKESLLKNPTDNQTRYNYAYAKLMQKKAEEKKPKEQKEKEKKEKDKKEQKEKQNKKAKENKDSNNKESEAEKEKGKKDSKKDKKGDKNKEDTKDEKNNEAKKANNQKPKVDPRLMQNLLKAVERQEQKTHNKVIQNNKVFSNQTNEKDW